jgi:2-amino-4-hydroxy-6-hydroxymethyldihydropteridine diphosphokinase
MAIFIDAYLGIGSNLGNRRRAIRTALADLNQTRGIVVECVSRIYETMPVGGPRQGKFLNAAIKIKTSVSCLALLRRLKEIEKSLGRKKTVRFGPRVIDLDILLYNNMIIRKKNLIVPHPRLFEREFVLKPLREIV